MNTEELNEYLAGAQSTLAGLMALVDDEPDRGRDVDRSDSASNLLQSPVAARGDFGTLHFSPCFVHDRSKQAVDSGLSLAQEKNDQSKVCQVVGRVFAL